MPEVITGLSLLLLFVAVGFDRGFWTVTLAHITFAMCFVAVVVQSRLVTFDSSLEEAALDLGAPPLKAFFLVTLPIIFPAVAAGWMLAFTLSLDDLVIASFTTGPGATTLPMRIYSQVRLGVTPEINAISTIMIASWRIGVCSRCGTRTRAGAAARALSVRATCRLGAACAMVKAAGAAFRRRRSARLGGGAWRAHADRAVQAERPVEQRRSSPARRRE